MSSLIDQSNPLPYSRQSEANIDNSVDIPQNTQKNAMEQQKSDMKGVSYEKLADGSTHAITMPAPTLDAASLMLALSSIQKGSADLSADNIATAIKGQQSEIAKLNQKRAEEMKLYFENMEKAARPKKVGLFGFIAKVYNAFCEAISNPRKIPELFTELGELAKNSRKEIFKDLVSIAAMLISSAIAIAATGGTGALVVGACLIGGLASLGAMAMSDPYVIDWLLEDTTDEERKEKQNWLMIGTIVCSLVSLACNLITIVASAKLDEIPKVYKLINKSVQLFNVATSATVNACNADDNYEVSKAQAEATKYSAEADKSLAEITKIEQELETRMEVLQDLFAIQQRMVESTCNMLNQIASGNQSAAAV